MKIAPLMTGGLLCGFAILLGESALNLVILADDWSVLMARFSLSPPSALAAGQAVVKLLLLGVFTTWLATLLTPHFGRTDRAALASGLIVWFLVWAWVQWGLVLSGYVTPRIASITVAWGLLELPACAWIGMWATRLASGRSAAAARST